MSKLLFTFVLPIGSGEILRISKMEVKRLLYYVCFNGSHTRYSYIPDSLPKIGSGFFIYPP